MESVGQNCFEKIVKIGEDGQPRSALLALLGQQPRVALLTDYDGTLTPIVADPEAAQCGAEVPRDLGQIADF